MSIEAMKQKQKECDCKDPSQCWEPCGELGHSAEHAKVHQQEQGEPVAWRDRKSGTLLHEEWLDADPLYTTPPQRKPLTDEECDDLWDMQLIHITDKFSARQFIRDVEAAHGIKE
jgi:hypothetical protein